MKIKSLFELWEENTVEEKQFNQEGLPERLHPIRYFHPKANKKELYISIESLEDYMDTHEGLIGRRELNIILNENTKTHEERRNEIIEL